MKPIQSPSRILVLRYRFLGDTILLIPFLRNLRHTYPNAVIDVLVSPNSGELLTHCPYINDLIFMDKQHNLWGWGGVLKQRQYDTAFVLKRSWSSAILACLCGAKQRIGFDTEGRGLLLTHRISYQKEQNEALSFCENLPVLPEPNTCSLEIFQHDTDIQWAKNIMAKANQTKPERNQHVGIHITASNPIKHLPTHFWTEYLTHLLHHHPVQLHALGAPSDNIYYETLRHSLPKEHQSLLHNHCGQTSLLQSQALISQYHALLGVDSGLLHIASAARIPTLGYYLPTNLSKWAATPTPGTPSPQNISLTSNQPKDWIAAWNTL